MADGKVSKNQRTAKAAPSKAAAVQGDQKLIIPLNAGKHAYVRVSNKSLHVGTSSEAFAAAITELGAERAPKVRAELAELHAAQPAHGWDETLNRLESAGVL